MSASLQRRQFLIGTATAGIASSPFIGFAQRKQRVYRVGVIALDTTGPIWHAFVDELDRLGYSQGINILFDVRSPLNFADDLDRLAKAMAQEAFDVIYTQGGPTALAAKKATSTIPIVFFASPDPVGMGLVSSLAHPEANLTGSSVQAWQTNVKELQLFAQACPNVTSMASLIRDPAHLLPLYPQLTAQMVDAGKALGIEMQIIGYDNAASELEPLVERLVREGVNGVAIADALHTTPYRRVANLLIKLRIPSIGFIDDGYLLNYEYSSPAIGRLGARQVDQIFKGAKPANLPVEQMSTFDLQINLRTAKAIGLSIPSSVLLQATRLIE